MSSGGGSKNESSGGSSTSVSIPGFLEPFVRDSTSTAGRALSGLESLLGLTGGEAQPVTPLGDVRGPNGQPVFVDPSQNAFVDQSGAVIAPFQDGVVQGLINGSNNPVEVRGNDVVGVGSGGVNELFTLDPTAGGGGGSAQDLVAGFTDAQIAGQDLGIERALFGDMFSSAQDSASGLASGGVDTSALSGLEAFGFSPDVMASLQNPAGTDSLESLLGGSVNDTTRDTLTSTAQGDYLFGGDGFNAAVDAAVRAAQPGIFSAFGSAGAGAGSGGLAQEAIGRAAIDAFAGQYAQERSNQLGAAGTLGQFDLADAGRRADVASTLAGIDTNAASLMGGLQLSGANQNLNQANALQNALQSSANTQLDAAQLIPGLATADIDLLQQIGGLQQAQAQNELDAPRNALLQLLTASLGGTPIASLLGQDTTSNNESRGAFLGFGG